MSANLAIFGCLAGWLVGLPSCAKAQKEKKRRGWDLNPRWSYPHSGFRDRPVQPLQHLSGIRQGNILRDHWTFVALKCCYSELDCSNRGER
jgi:hypothetical protein